ncbi:hypothetical protein [Planobispora takensis]|uniref:Uncharacterized protein n=1 Tax=Planobispora takensis TaxID=1367882 RepID=A0A8J3WWN6_9ACTN|nr:hypothetical protein [Planobispora takensis]GII03983.1 hypothetical protein Pta02_59910 [Planobispora takensis]
MTMSESSMAQRSSGSTTQQQYPGPQTGDLTQAILETGEDQAVVQEVVQEIRGKLEQYTEIYRRKYRVLTERAQQAQMRRQEQGHQQGQSLQGQGYQQGQGAYQQSQGMQQGQGYQQGQSYQQGQAGQQSQQGQQGQWTQQIQPGQVYQQGRPGQQAQAMYRPGYQESGISPEETTPITPLPVPYLWFDLMAVGPYQRVVPGGPLQPSRVIQSGYEAYLFAVLWRNPTPLAGGPAAAAVMAPLTYQIRGLTVDLNTVSQGPVLSLPPAAFGPGFINILPMRIPTVPAPADGRPRLLEIYITVDVLGPGIGLPPFAGFATRWFHPDLQPAFLGAPDILPGFVEESPVRVMVYS